MDNKKIASNIIWNTIGNIFYLGCQWLLNVVVIRVSGNYADAGVLTLAISVTNIFATLAAFSVRNYQVSDAEAKYSESDYISHRILTCSGAFILCIIFTFICGYRIGTMLSILAYMLMKTVEAFADVFHGILQKQWRLDVVGRSCIYRGAVLLISFTAAYRLLGNFPVAVLIMALSTVLSFLFYDFRVVNRFAKISYRFDKRCLINLSKDCLPVLECSILINSIVLVARFFIEQYHGEEILGYYGSVSTIAVIVQTASSLILTPLNGVISNNYMQGRPRDIYKLTAQAVLLLAAITGAALVGAALFGEFILVLLFGYSIAPYVYLLIPTIIASCLTAFVWFLGMLLTIMRAMKQLIIGATMGACTSIMLSIVLIPRYMFQGANIAIIASLAIVASTYLFAVAKKLQK